jgi:hypothetical protein
MPSSRQLPFRRAERVGSGLGGPGERMRCAVERPHGRPSGAAGVTCPISAGELSTDVRGWLDAGCVVLRLMVPCRMVFTPGDQMRRRILGLVLCLVVLPRWQGAPR